MEKTIKQLESDFARLTEELQAQQKITIPLSQKVDALKNQIETQRSDNENLAEENAKQAAEIDKHKRTLEENRESVELFDAEMSRVRSDATAVVLSLRLTNSEKQTKIEQLDNCKNTRSVSILVDAWKALSESKLSPPMPPPNQQNSAVESAVKVYNPLDPNQY